MTTAEAANVLREQGYLCDNRLRAEALFLGAAALEREAAADDAEPLAMCCNGVAVRYEAVVPAAYPPAVLATRLRATARKLERETP